MTSLTRIVLFSTMCLGTMFGEEVVIESSISELTRTSRRGIDHASLTVVGTYRIPAIDPEKFRIDSVTIEHSFDLFAANWDYSPSPIAGWFLACAVIGYEIGYPNNRREGGSRTDGCDFFDTTSNSTSLLTIADIRIEYGSDEASGFYGEVGSFTEFPFTFEAGAGAPSNGSDGSLILLAWKRPTVRFFLTRVGSSLSDLPAGLRDIFPSSQAIDLGQTHPEILIGSQIDEELIPPLDVNLSIKEGKEVHASFFSLAGYRYQLTRSSDLSFENFEVVDEVVGSDQQVVLEFVDGVETGFFRVSSEPVSGD